MFLYRFEVDGFYKTPIMATSQEENVMVSGLFYVLKSLKHHGVAYVGISSATIVYLLR